MRGSGARSLSGHRPIVASLATSQTPLSTILRASPRSTRPSLLRRLTAGVLWAVLGVTLIAEPLLADVCDGDAPAAARSAVIPHRDIGALGADHASDAQVMIVGTESAEGAERTELPARPPGSQHDVHVCHCVHSHGGTLSRRCTLGEATALDTDAVSVRGDRVPPSPALEPGLRPPALPRAA